MQKRYRKDHKTHEKLVVAQALIDLMMIQFRALK